MATANAITLALYWSRRDVKASLRAQGLKPQHIEPAEITRAARIWLTSHPELINQAQTWLELRSKLTTRAQKPKP